MGTGMTLDFANFCAVAPAHGDGGNKEVALPQALHCLRHRSASLSYWTGQSVPSMGLDFVCWRGAGSGVFTWP